MDSAWKIGGVGHFNGAADSTSDVVWVNSVTNHVQIWQMQNGQVANIVNPSGLDGTEWHLEAVGSFEGDANSDLLWISNSGAVSVWEINSSSVQAISVSAPAGDTLQLSSLAGAAAAPQTDGAGTQPATMTIGTAGNDTFVFRPGFGADVIVNPENSDRIELDGFAVVPSIDQLRTILHEAQNGEAQSILQAANGGHDTVINLGNHDSITLVNMKVTDLLASNFMIHG
jgi:hypothetical protein